MITICAATRHAALLFEGAVTAHLLFGYPVEDEEDVDDINPTRCEITNKHKDFLFEASVIFWDEFISYNCILMEAASELLKRLWKKPRYYIFICAGDFAQVSQC